MACTLTTGRKLPCKSAFGGIKRVFFADFGNADIGTITIGATGTATFDGTPTWYEYEVKGSSSLETTVTSSRDTGTTFYTQTLNLTLTFLDAKTQNELQILAVGRPYVVVEDYYGNSFLIGAENGAECTSGTVSTGSAAGDMSGFTIVFEAIEETAPYFLAAAVVGDAEQIDPTA